MTTQFQWVPDLERAQWFRTMEEEPFGSILSIVPSGFEAYARVFHPVERDRPRSTRTWAGIDVPSFAALSAVLARHTSTPDAGIAAIWEGWGGLMSSAGSMELRSYVPSESPGLSGLGSRLTAALAQRIWNVSSAIKTHPWFNRSEPMPGTGVLSAEIASGPRFSLHADTGRSYVLFEAGANDLADTGWPERAPWIDEPMWPQSPSILWPEDHTWVLATEIDFDSTLIAGSADLIRELVQTPGLEVLPISADADLTWGGDTVNRRA